VCVCGSSSRNSGKPGGHAIRPALALIVVNGRNKWAEFAQMTVTEREIGTREQGSRCTGRKKRKEACNVDEDA